MSSVDGVVGVGGVDAQIGDRQVLAAVEQDAGHDLDGLLPVPGVEGRSTPGLRVDERQRGGRRVKAAQPADDLAHPGVAHRPHRPHGRRPQARAVPRPSR